MDQLFKFNLEKISHSSKKEETDRKNNLKLFLENGFPGKKDENWKFTDLNLIIKKNFKNISNNHDFTFDKKKIETKDKENHSFISNENTDDLMTETLAKLYFEQGHFEQAIRAYKILCLKYPKKSSLFAKEIKKLTKLK